MEPDSYHGQACSQAYILELSTPQHPATDFVLWSCPTAEHSLCPHPAGGTASNTAQLWGLTSGSMLSWDTACDPVQPMLVTEPRYWLHLVSEPNHQPGFTSEPIPWSHLNAEPGQHTPDLRAWATAWPN